MSPSAETIGRFSAFLLVFVAMAAWEVVAPWRAGAPKRRRRWVTNLALAALDASVVRLVMPLGAIGVAWIAERQGWGVMRWSNLPAGLATVLSVVLLDFGIYAQHVAFHAAPWLWRLHRVHHADEHLDASTGVRFHPLEALLSLGWKALLILALGASALAVLIFELALNLGSLFNHANVSLPRRLEPWARWLVVTPAMHRVHHSVERFEHDSNYGFSLPWWDRLFGTYRAAAMGGDQVRFGLSETAREPTESLRWTLGAPFTSRRSERRRR